MSHRILGRQFIMRAADIHRKYPGGAEWESQEGEEPSDMMQRKLQESVESGLAEHIAQHGMQAPISVDSRQRGIPGAVSDGWHRLSAALAVNPDMWVTAHADYGQLSSPDQFDKEGNLLPRGHRAPYNEEESHRAGPAA